MKPSALEAAHDLVRVSLRLVVGDLALARQGPVNSATAGEDTSQDTSVALAVYERTAGTEFALPIRMDLQDLDDITT